MIKGQNKYISSNSIRKIKKHQKFLQLKEFNNKGRKAKSISFYKALDDLLRGVK